MDKTLQPSLSVSTQGTVGQIPIQLRLRPGSPTLAVIAHGMGGTLESSIPRMILANAEFPASVAVFTTSRYVTENRPLDYAAMRDIFRDKVYVQEVEDVRRAIRQSLETVSTALGMPQSAIDLVLIGTSMGGISIATLAEEFPVRGVVIVNSGAWFKGADVLPRLVEGFPNMEGVRAVLSRFSGQVLVLRGALDPIVSREAAQALAAMAKKGEFVEIPDFAHSISAPQTTPTATAELMDRIRQFVAN